MKIEPLSQNDARELRHYVVYTNEDVVEFLADIEPVIDYVDEVRMPPIVPATARIRP